jgi:UDP-N-acetylmuramoylalanine--D-glutamate ligase
MNSSSAFFKSHFGILGLARTGLACLEYFVKIGHTVFCYDDNQILLNQIKEKYGNSVIIDKDSEFFSELNYLITSPGIPSEGEKKHDIIIRAEKYDIEIISDLDILYMLKPDARYIGITGTNGKSTTTCLLYEIVKQKYSNVFYGGNIGIPVLNLPLDEINKDSIIVLELSSFQLVITRFLKLHSAIITNIAPDHLDRHGNLENYIKAKASIAKLVKTDCAIILNQDDKLSKKLKKYLNNLKINPIYFSVKQNRPDVSDCNNNNLLGTHNASNIKCAYLAAKNIGIEDEFITKGINVYKPLSHRCEQFLTYKNISFINDSKATNFHAASQALFAYKNIIWIAGGICKDDGIGGVSEYAKNIEMAYYYGKDKNLYKNQSEKYIKNIILTDILKEAVTRAIDYALSNTNKNYVILLSPSSLSTDQFKDFEDRGCSFKNICTEATQLISQEK